MIELFQIPWSPYCFVQRRILEYSGARFKITNVSSADRSVIWRLTKERYYAVPVLRDGKTVIFETAEDSQVIAKYLNNQLELDLFPEEWRGIQTVLWRAIENEVEGVGFKLNDVYWKEFVPAKEQCGFVRHKERKFGVGCLDRWRREQSDLFAELTRLLAPFEQRLLHRPFLLDDRPRFVDFDLFGILENAFYSGHYKFPKEHVCLNRWRQRMTGARIETAARHSR